MGSSSQNGKPFIETVPLIDISEVTISSNRATFDSPTITKIIKEIRNACIQWGFFYVVGHGLRRQLTKDLKDVGIQFFKQPKEFKKTVLRGHNNYRGYTDHELTKQKLDWKEAFDFGAEYLTEVNTIENGIDLDSGTNQWPDDMPHFKDILLQYLSDMHSLATTVMDLIFISLDVDPRTMRHHFNKNSDTSFCRLNYYPVCPDANNQLGVGPHSDAGVLTILLQDENISSLQVEKDGKFYHVPPIPDSFVINIGDMMQVWSNGLLKAPVHRVLASSERERFSVPFFFNPSYKTNVEPLGQCVSNDRPCYYRAVNWGVFRQGRILGDYADHGEEIQIKHFEISE